MIGPHPCVKRRKVIRLTYESILPQAEIDNIPITIANSHCDRDGEDRECSRCLTSLDSSDLRYARLTTRFMPLVGYAIVVFPSNGSKGCVSEGALSTQHGASVLQW